MSQVRYDWSALTTLTKLGIVSMSSGNDSASYQFTQQVGHLLRKAYQRHVAIFQQHFGGSQLTSMQFITLCAVSRNGPSSVTELVAATSVDQATIRGVIERLKSRDLVTLGHDAQDRRKVIVDLTEAGREAVDQAIPSALEISELTQSNLNPGERIALNFLLTKMLADPADTDTVVSLEK